MWLRPVATQNSPILPRAIMQGADIADSDAAYDGDKPRPEQSSKKMEKEVSTRGG
jgi:hypothetical protein